jgi:hypothetical protein
MSPSQAIENPDRPASLSHGREIFERPATAQACDEVPASASNSPHLLPGNVDLELHTAGPAPHTKRGHTSPLLRQMDGARVCHLRLDLPVHQVPSSSTIPSLFMTDSRAYEVDASKRPGQGSFAPRPRICGSQILGSYASSAFVGDRS